MTIYQTAAGDQLDRICHRYYGHLVGTVEAVLEANPGLADLGAVYAAGVTVILPDLGEPNATADRVELWT
jgi:phage tail protein X